ncbi:MAG: LLM class flavin-dependent oxidoreductase [Nitrososphaerales archaeon]
MSLNAGNEIERKRAYLFVVSSVVQKCGKSNQPVIFHFCLMKLADYGVTVAWQGATIEALTAIAREADGLGFGYFWLPEAWSLEAFSAASHLLSKTEKIRIGTGIVNVYSRSAALIGMGCATLDQIAHGRFLLGLGSSGRGLIESFHGLRFEKPLERTKEYVVVIRKVARGESVDYSGDLLKLSRFKLFTKPVESLEIYLGAIGEKNLKLAGEICDGAIITMYPFSRLGVAMNAIGGTANRGKKLFAYFPTMLTGSNEELGRAREQVARNIAFYVASMGGYYSSNLSKLGFGDEVKKIIDAHSGNKGTVSGELIDELALVGDQNTILDRVARIPIGVHPVLAFSAKTSGEVMSAINSMRLIAASLRE